MPVTNAVILLPSNHTLPHANRLSARQALKHPYFREMHQGDNGAEEEVTVKKGFAPFKPQRRRKRDKQQPAPNEGREANKPNKPNRAELSQMKQTSHIDGSGAPAKIAREKGLPEGRKMTKLETKENITVVANSLKQKKQGGMWRKDDLQREKREHRDREKKDHRDREREERKRRRERERRDRHDRHDKFGGRVRGHRGHDQGPQKVEKKVGVLPNGSQVLPPISKAHPKKNIQSIKIDMAPSRTHRSHRHEGRSNHSHRNHRNGYPHGQNSKYQPHGSTYHKMKYYGKDSSRRHGVVKSHRGTHVHSNRNRNFHGHYMGQKQSSSTTHYHGGANGGHQHGYHRSKGHNKHVFNVSSHHGNGGARGVQGQYGRFGYQHQMGNLRRVPHHSNKYLSPYSQKALKHHQATGHGR